MLQRNKKLMALILSVLLCISMLSVVALPAMAETEAGGGASADPYAVIETTTVTGSNALSPTNAVFVCKSFGSGDYVGTFDYTYGDGETWGNGKTYRLTYGTNAFRNLYEGIYKVRDTWNAADTDLENYVGPDTVVVAPGSYAGNQWQNNENVVYDLPAGFADGDPYTDLMTVHILGPQAGVSPVTDAIDHTDPKPQNGRSTDTSKEAVSTSTMWEPLSAYYIVDGFSMSGDHNYYGRSNYKYSAVTMTNCYQHVNKNYANGIFRLGYSSAHTRYVEFSNYFIEYEQLNTAVTGEALAGDVIKFSNFYEDSTKVLYTSDQHKQAYQKNVYITPAKYLAEGFVPEYDGAHFIVENSTINNHKSAHWVRFKFNHADYSTTGADDAETAALTAAAKDAYTVTFDNTHLLDVGDLVRTTYNNASATTQKDSTGYTDTISFQDDFTFSSDSAALNFNFTNNTVEYTLARMNDAYDGNGNYNMTKTATYTGLINVHANNASDFGAQKHDIIFKNNTVIMPENNSLSTNYEYFNTKVQVDVSSTVYKNEKNEVTKFYTRGVNTNDSIFDSYAGDDFMGGIVEMFTLRDAADMAVVNNQINASTTSSKPQAPTADVSIIPYANEKSHVAKDLFEFKGKKVEFVALYAADGSEITEAKPSELDGTKMVAMYRGTTTTCTVTYNITIVDESQYGFVDATGTFTGDYEWNGETYTLDDSNTYATITAAYKAKKPAIILLPGTHQISSDSKNANYVQFMDLNAAVLGPSFGTSPILNNNELNTVDWAITDNGDGSYTPDTTKEAVLTGRAYAYYFEATLWLEGFVADALTVNMADATNTWGYCRGGGGVVTIVENVFWNNIAKDTQGFDGLNSGDSLLVSKNKRAAYVSNTYLAANGGSWSFISAGLYDVEIDHVYAENGTGPFMTVRMPSGIQQRLSPMNCGLEINNSVFENWGTTVGNWIYTNYADYTTDPSFAKSAYCMGEYFPAGIHQIFNNNKFIGMGAAGCETKGYALRLAIPYDMPNASIVFTNNIVEEETLSTYKFIDTCSGSKAPGAYIKKENVDISGNVFINFQEPIQLSSLNKEITSDIINLDENYFATTVNGKEVVTAIVADEKQFVTKSDWYYMDRELTVKDTDYAFDLSSVSVDYEVKTFPDFTITANMICGLSTVTVNDLLGENAAEGMTIVGLYSDADCTTELTGNVTENNFYALASIDGVEVPFKVSLTKTAQHSWGSYVTTLEPTCTEKGSAERICSACQSVQTTEIAALGHVESEPTVTAPTCTENAGLYVICIRCEERVSGSEIPDTLLGHDWSEWEITTEGDCTTDEVSDRHCKRDGCDAHETETVTAIGHVWTDWEEVTAPTCTENGVQQRGCENCDIVEELPITSEGHDFKAVTTEPDCIHEGETIYVCSICDFVDEEQTVVIPATGNHTWGNYLVNEPTCCAAGITERFCTVCYSLDEATRTITPADPDAHTYPEEWTLAQEGNCVQPQIEEKVCTGCGHTLEQIDDSMVNTDGHPYEEVITAATKDQSGKVEHVCSDCGDVKLIRIIPRVTAFTDLSYDKWYAGYINSAVSYGLLKGYEDGTIRPEANVTRAEAVTMIARVAGVDTSDYSTDKFTDVSKKAWYNGAIAWAEQNKIVSGRTEFTFDPEGNISRQELCTVLVRFAKFEGITMEKKIAKSVFADDASIAKYAKSSVYACQRAEIVSGRPNNKFEPNGYATRAEVAKILVTFMEDYVL